MAEARHVHIDLSFRPTPATWMRVGAAAGALVAAVLASIALGVGWASFEVSISGNGFDSTSGGQYETFEVSGQGSMEYSSSEFDGEDGIGLMRTAGPLAIVGLVLGFLAVLALAAAALTQVARLDLIAAGVASLAAVFLALTVVLLPIGIDQFHDDGGNSEGGFSFEVSGLRWGAGLVLGILAAAFAVASSVAAWLSLRPAGSAA